MRHSYFAYGSNLCVRQMARRGFPVARVLEYGYRRGLPYYLEGSLGSSTLGDLFQAEVDTCMKGFAAKGEAMRANAPPSGRVNGTTTAPLAG